jgi:hypothetical protein
MNDKSVLGYGPPFSAPQSTIGVPSTPDIIAGPRGRQVPGSLINAVSNLPRNAAMRPTTTTAGGAIPLRLASAPASAT